MGPVFLSGAVAEALPDLGFGGRGCPSLRELPSTSPCTPRHAAAQETDGGHQQRL